MRPKVQKVRLYIKGRGCCLLWTPLLSPKEVTVKTALNIIKNK